MGKVSKAVIASGRCNFKQLKLHVPSGSVKTNCENDPRVHWRGASIGVDGNGDMSWYRMDNFDNKEDPVVSSAYEYVIPTNNGFVMISDELMGFGFASYALGIVWTF